jgi:hypothetical protein
MRRLLALASILALLAPAIGGEPAGGEPAGSPGPVSPIKTGLVVPDARERARPAPRSTSAPNRPRKCLCGCRQ